jgi:tetrahydromethanopterin S-methyltransferase subunit G
MTTATKARHEDPKEVYSEKELAQQQETLDEIREEHLPRLREEREELREEIAEAVAEGGDPEDARERLETVDQRLEEFHAAAELLDARIRERRRRRLAHEAEERLTSIQKKVGGLVGEAPRRAEKARELAEKLAAQLEWLAHARLRRHLLKVEARGLASSFDGLEVPELRRFEKSPTEVVAEARRTVRGASGPHDGLWQVTEVREVVGLLGRLFDEDSPTPALLDRLTAVEEAGDGQLS